MKNVIKLFSVLFLVGGIMFISCEKKPKDTPTTPTPVVIDPPTKLSVSDITEVSAKFTWSGAADSYEIAVGEKTFTQESVSLLLSNLTEGTKYSWKVRAKKGADYSIWVDGVDFTTKSLPDGSVSVYFGNVNWTTNLAILFNYGEVLGGFVYKNNPEQQLFPYIEFICNPSGITTYVEDDDKFYFEYGETGQLSDGTYNYGDWWAKTGTLSLTSVTGGKASGIADFVMFSAVQKYLDENPDPETRNLTIIFKNINVQNPPSAPHKNIKSKPKMSSNYQFVTK
jgi:hypothetical protein